ncbi:disrupted in schizophrenia 1 protein isoform X1 [Phyllostomus hastatus]|uniref:disrupted in schizophrenia 1 protein isoform X1 n=2 Tax=Phyllostomus hastatus TaxID=9423 RepID=UPI001E6822D5|nr:disrupted in schizophrenia 1 protein isoform X1 [Phyllostomus hastatus]
MPGGGPPGAPAGGGGDQRAGSQDCRPPAAAFRRRRLARKPGYMRREAAPQIRFLSPAVGTSFRAQGGACGEESHHSESRAGRQCGLEPGGQWPGPLVGSLLPRSSAASAGTCVGHRGLSRAPARGTSGFCGIQFGAGTKPPSRLTRLCGPGCQGELPPMDSAEACGPRQDATCGEGARGTQIEDSPAPEEVSGSSCGLRSGPRDPSAPARSQAAFTSSFSFIQLSLCAAGERGEAEGCPPFREAEDAEAKAAGLDRLHEDPRLFSPPFSLKAAQGSADSAQIAGGSPALACEPLSVLDIGAASCCSQSPSTFESTAPHWDLLLRKCEPLLLECLLGNRRQLEVNSLRLKLQKLQEKAVEEDDYDNAEALKRRLEDLEEEKSSLRFQFPSRQPVLCSLLVYLGAQAEAALRQAAQQAGGEDAPAPLGVEPPAQDPLGVAITRRDWLLQEKQQLQKEIAALQARMSMLEAKDQQLRREIDLQEQLLRWQGCDLSPLMGRLSPSELQEVRDAVQDTLALANQIPLPAGPPESIRSLQERIKPLTLSLKEITAKVCRTERLCSTLRKKVNEIDTQLPALFEAKMLAISGSHFGTAKELTEEIRSLTSEKEGLEGLLHTLSVLSSRNARKLGSVREDYSRLRRDLDHGKTAHETSMKEKAVKYMDVLVDKLRSCTCPLLGRVWGADLEACQLLLQSLQLPDPGGGPSAAEEKQVDDSGGAASATVPGCCPPPRSEDERRTPLQALGEWRAQPAPSPPRADSKQKEELYIISAELGEKCEAIGQKLLYLEDQLHVAIQNHDEDLIQCLRRELQMVKDTLQAMILQLQPAKEAGEREAAASCVTAGALDALPEACGAVEAGLRR